MGWTSIIRIPQASWRPAWAGIWGLRSRNKDKEWPCRFQPARSDLYIHQPGRRGLGIHKLVGALIQRIRRGGKQFLVVGAFRAGDMITKQPRNMLQCEQ